MKTLTVFHSDFTLLPGLLQKKYEEVLDKIAQEYFHFAINSAKPMQILIDILLEYSRVGREHFKKVNVDFNEVLKEVQNNDNVYALIKELDADIILSSQLLIFSASKQKNSRVFQNLINTAIKFRRPGDLIKKNNL